MGLSLWLPPSKGCDFFARRRLLHLHTILFIREERTRTSNPAGELFVMYQYPSDAFLLRSLDLVSNWRLGANSSAT